jgi:hypothetical protein
MALGQWIGNMCWFVCSICKEIDASYISLCVGDTLCAMLDETRRLYEKDFINILVEKNRFGIHMVDMPPFLCDDGNINVHCFLWLAQMFIDINPNVSLITMGDKMSLMLCGGVERVTFQFVDSIWCTFRFVRWYSW